MYMYMHAIESTLDSGTSGTTSHSSQHDMLAIILSWYQYNPLLLLLQKLCQITWLLTGRKNFLYFRRPPLRPVAFATSATMLIRHWHQLGHMQVCTSLQTDNHASTPPLRFLQAGCPSCHPTNSIKALKAIWAATSTHKIISDNFIRPHINQTAHKYALNL